jgi:gentisate 1,2-dioxygenase
MKSETFIRFNETLIGAFAAALADSKTDLEEYEYQNSDQEIDYVESEDENDASVVRIINPNTGYEYQAYIIKKVDAGA